MLSPEYSMCLINGNYSQPQSLYFCYQQYPTYGQLIRFLNQNEYNTFKMWQQNNIFEDRHCIFVMNYNMYSLLEMAVVHISLPRSWNMRDKEEDAVITISCKQTARWQYQGLEPKERSSIREVSARNFLKDLVQHLFSFFKTDKN